jgi:hypothetical protein
MDSSFEKAFNIDAVSILHNQYEALAVLAASTAVSF